MHCKHLDILAMWVVVALLACGLVAPFRSWAQDGFALGEPVRLTQGSIFGDASWSPDGSKILFHRYGERRGHLYVVNANGTNPVLLTASLPSERGPQKFQYVNGGRWSPDGTKITFNGNLSSCFLLRGYDPDSCFVANHTYVVNADGTNLVWLSEDINLDLRSLGWLQDGTKILLSVTSKEYRLPPAAPHTDEDLLSFPVDEGIAVINADGTNFTPLIMSSSLDDYRVGFTLPYYSIAASPDGSKIAFLFGKSLFSSSSGELGKSLYVMNADGTNLIRLMFSKRNDGGGGFLPVVTGWHQDRS